MTGLEPIKISLEQREFLNPFLRSWTHLYDGFIHAGFTLDTYRRLLVLESEGKCREHILERLQMKFRSKLREIQRIEMNLPISESKIEKAVSKYAEWKGCLSYKFSSPGNIGVPDRMFLWKYGRILFVEFKRKGKKLRKSQDVVKAEIEYRNHYYSVCDNIEEGKILIDTLTFGGDDNESQTQ